MGCVTENVNLKAATLWASALGIWGQQNGDNCQQIENYKGEASR